MFKKTHWEPKRETITQWKRSPEPREVDQKDKKSYKRDRKTLSNISRIGKTKADQIKIQTENTPGVKKSELK